MTLKFPSNFLWGSATSAHQVEGGNYLNDWWDWEQAGRVENREISGIACDHFNRFEEDFELAESLGHNAHRLSLEWSRIEPAEGEYSDSALYHYRQVLESLHRHKLVPMVTLYHFTLPRWVSAKGGWENERILIWFERYARKCAETFGDLVPLWVTINEPMIYFFESYLLGEWPPGKSAWAKKMHVIRHLVQAHARLYEGLHDEMDRRNWKGEVGLASYYKVFEPWKPYSFFDQAMSRMRDYLLNQIFLNAIHTGVIGFPAAINRYEPNLKGAWDFIGLNYYSREKVRFHPSHWRTLFSEEMHDPSAEKNSLGWEIYPQGFYRALKALKQFGRPIYVTENGIATQDDRQRQKFIVEHLKQLYQVIQEGLDVRGYFHWSLLDNFEWAHGWAPHFGLIAVDPKTQERTVKESARLYAQIAKANALEVNKIG